MVVRLLLAISSLILSLSAQATPLASVDRAVVEEGGTFRLTIETDGPTVEPEALDVLREDFSITGTHETSSFTFINGVESITKKIILTLLPKKLGTLTIPSIQVGSEQTEPISVAVTELTEDLKKEIAKHAFIEVEAEPKTQYVHAPIRVTRRLYYSANAQADERLPSLSNLNDARVIVAQPEYMSSAEVDGSHYNVVSQEFIIYPAKSGTMVLPAFTINVYLPVSGFQRRYQDRRIASSEIELEVLPVPSAFPADKPWFPAFDVQLARALSPDDLMNLEVGQTFRDEVTITALGSYGAAIPPLDYGALDGLRIYADSPTISDGTQEGMSLGRYYQSTNFVVSAGGNSVLEPLEVFWWNLNTNKVEVSRLPEIPIFAKSAPAAAVAPSGPSVPSPQPSIAAESPDIPVESQPVQNPANAQATHDDPYWMLLILVAIAGVLVGIVSTLISSRLRRPPALAKVDHAGSLRRLEAQLNSADAVERKRLVLEWLSKHQGVDEHVAAWMLMSDAEGTRLLSDLNAAVYSRHPSPPQASAAHITHFLKQFVENQRKTQNLVPGLYDLQSALN